MAVLYVAGAVQLNLETILIEANTSFAREKAVNPSHFEPNTITSSMAAINVADAS